MPLFTCYNALSFGYWQELCHEYMPFVLPTDDSSMSVDDLSSPMWRIIFLKDDCFLQPSCEVTCPSSDTEFLATRTSSSNQGKLNAGTTSNTTIRTTTTVAASGATITTATATATATDIIDNCDHHDPTTCPSNPIEPLFEGIDLNQHQTYKDTPEKSRYSESDGASFNSDTEHHVLLGLDVSPLSPSLSRSPFSLSFSDLEQSSHQQQKNKHSVTTTKAVKRKRKNTAVQQPQPQKQKRHRQKKQRLESKYSVDGSDRLSAITMTLGSTTLFQQLSYAGIDWCRYCGTTEGVNWRPGPWGKRTLCNKHGCDYKGYGLASRLPRLDLSGYRHELVQDRHRPVIQEFCTICQERGCSIRRINDDSDDDGGIMDSDNEEEDQATLVVCDGGCSRAFHRQCFHINNKTRHDLWFCSSSCSENRRKRRVVVDLPRKQPLMRAL